MTMMIYIFPKWETVEDVGRYMSKNSRFRTLFEREHGKRSQTLLKSVWQNLYYIYW